MFVSTKKLVEYPCNSRLKTFHLECSFLNCDLDNLGSLQVVFKIMASFTLVG